MSESSVRNLRRCMTYSKPAPLRIRSGQNDGRESGACVNIRFNVTRLKRRAEKMMIGSSESGGLLDSWSGVDLSNDASGRLEFLSHVERLLPSAVDRLALENSSLELFSLGELNRLSLEEYCWRIAANLDWLRIGRAIPPLRSVRLPAFAPVQVIYTRPGWVGRNPPRFGSMLTLRAIAGDLCALRIQRWVSTRFTWALARALKLTGRCGVGYSGNPSQLYGVRFVARIVEDRYGRTFDRFDPGQFSVYNRRLMKRRAEPCPNKYEWPCHECSLGEDQCPSGAALFRACRPQSITSIFCRRCNGARPHDAFGCLQCAKRKPRSENTHAQDQEEGLGGQEVLEP